MKSGTVVKCPKCVQLTVRRADGSKIVGWVPEATYVAYLKVDRRHGAVRPPRTCPACGTPLIERTG